MVFSASVSQKLEGGRSHFKLCHLSKYSFGDQVVRAKGFFCCFALHSVHFF